MIVIYINLFYIKSYIISALIKAILGSKDNYLCHKL